MDYLKAYKNKKILITGATGFIASNLVQALGEVDCQIVRMSRKKDLGTLALPRAKVVDVSGDVRERPIWEESLEGIDFIFHLAAQTSIAEAEEDPYADFNCNVLPMIHLLNICREKGWMPAVLFAGTATSFGIPQAIPVNELHTDNPLTPYCMHKKTAERYLKDYVGLGAVKGVSLRLCNVYGPGPERSSQDRGVLNKMIHRAEKGEPLYLYGSVERIRDYVYIDDVIRAFLMAGAAIDQINGDFFLIGAGRGYSLREAFELVANRVAQKTGKKVAIEHRSAPADYPTIEERNFIADSRRFSKATGWKPELDLSAGIDKTINLSVATS